MTTMLERAARAVDDETYGELTDLRCAAIARAVLVAVREPDRKLSCIGAEAADDGGRYEQPMPGQCYDAFTAMIDAILEGK